MGMPLRLVELGQLLARCDGLVHESEETVLKISKLLEIFPATSGNVDFFRACSLDKDHRMSAELLVTHESKCELLKGNVDPCAARDQFIHSHSFFYKDAPGVISSVDSSYRLEEAEFMPLSNKKNDWPEFERIFFPAIHRWKILKELTSWRCIPKKCSRLILSSFLQSSITFERATHVVSKVGCIPPKAMSPVSWLLTIVAVNVAHDIAPCLDSFSNVPEMPENTVDCPSLFANFAWLCKQLEVLIPAKEAEEAGLDILRHVIKFGFSPPVSNESKSEDAKIGRASSQNEKYPMSRMDVPDIIQQLISATGTSEEKHTRAERLEEYSRLIDLASKKRANQKYFEVPDNDGVLNFAKKDEKKKMSAAETAAKERDFRRRRIRYRTSSNKKDPKQVMRNLIDGQMKALLAWNESSNQSNEGTNNKAVGDEKMLQKKTDDIGERKEARVRDQRRDSSAERREGRRAKTRVDGGEHSDLVSGSDRWEPARERQFHEEQRDQGDVQRGNKSRKRTR